ncbi:MAG: site-specific recombinase [Solirubrobacteraceae bacterium]|jgi:hypothetical protein|nr:site-specific recombinase [Solirubrobacteraceae bacterium]
MATRRIEELTVRRDTLNASITDLQGRRPQGARPDAIEAMLTAVPDLRPTVARAEPAELAKLFEAFDLAVEYDKPDRRLTLAVTVAPELVPALQAAQAARDNEG